METQQGATKARIDGTATSLECIKAELNFERTARQGFEAELAARREVLVVFKNNKLSNGRALALLLLLLALIFLLWSMFLFWYIWNRMQLPLAVVSRIDLVHMYPETSEAWMMMDKLGWFGWRLRRDEAERRGMMSKAFDIFACFSLLFLQMEFGNGGKLFSS